MSKDENMGSTHIEDFSQFPFFFRADQLLFEDYEKFIDINAAIA